MVEVLIDKLPAWLSGTGPEAALAPRTRGSLSRSLADFAFPSHCSDDEKRASEERVLSALESANLLSMGQYCSLLNLDARETQLLYERGLITPSLMHGTGARGVFISHDQSLSILVNDEDDHLRIEVTASGLQPKEVWSRLNGIDDLLAGPLDFAFDERMGYLSGDLARVGSGLRLEVLLHLPALGMSNGLLAAEQFARDQQHSLEGAFGSLTEGRGDLYLLQNRRTLGRSEEEIAFHVKHVAMDILGREIEARQGVLIDNTLAVEDRVGRALGTARGARLLEFPEALNLLSSLRLGLEAGLVNGYTYAQLNELLLLTQRAHLELRDDAESDEIALSARRAELLHARFQ
jgi:protein arginine kinase